MRLGVRSLAIASFACVVASANVQAQGKPSKYAGTWVLDPAKSQSSQSVPTATTWAVVVQGDTVMVDREATSGQAAPVKSHIVVAIDGQAWKNMVPQAGVGDVETSTTASWDGAVLVMSTTGNIAGHDLVQADRWSLAADGKMLTSYRATTLDGQPYSTSTLVFIKKN